jgi:hypothetical protein
LETRRTTQAIFAPIFNQTVALNAKSLIVLMVFPFALLPALVFYRSRCFPCTSMLPAAAPDRLFGGPGLESASFDHALSITELIACAIYLYIAAGNAYGARGVARVFQVLPLVLAVAGIFLGYRFVLFLITFYSA